MTDYAQEQEMELEALQAIVMDDFKEIGSHESGLNTSNPCFQIILSPQDDADESTTTPGIQAENLKILKTKLEQEIVVLHGEPVTIETFLAWREQFEAELALEQANSQGEEDIEFDDEDFEDDDDMLEHYLAKRSDSSTHSSRRGN